MFMFLPAARYYAAKSLRDEIYFRVHFLAA
jgi:hypothetical protein